MPADRNATVDVGTGPPLLVLQGFAMQPRTYLPLAELLSPKVRVVIPPIFDLPRPWTFSGALDAVRECLDQRGLERVSILGHSFGGAIEVGLAARDPDRVVECVFADTLAAKDRFFLAGEAMRHPLGLRHMATTRAMSAFAHSVVTEPLQLVRAGLWAFAADRHADIARVAAAGIPCHVLWASRDTLLHRSDGEEFARLLNASFTLAEEGCIDHDWVFENAPLFVEYLESLPLKMWC